jgi:FtsP/CotA-like multicopper oxidase with cupredoxin domain
VGALASVGAVVAAVAAALLLMPPSSAQPAAAPTYQPQQRVYYLAADEVRWNYAPQGKNGITGQPFDEQAAVFTKRGRTRIGSTYLKALYQAYTDATFTQLAPRPPQWQHLGMLGPVVRAVVGDRVTIVFKNNLHRPASVHVHGFQYNNDSEGAPTPTAPHPARPAATPWPPARPTPTPTPCPSGPAPAPWTAAR